MGLHGRVKTQIKEQMARKTMLKKLRAVEGLQNNDLETTCASWFPPALIVVDSGLPGSHLAEREGRSVDEDNCTQNSDRHPPPARIPGKSVGIRKKGKRRDYPFAMKETVSDIVLVEHSNGRFEKPRLRDLKRVSWIRLKKS